MVLRWGWPFYSLLVGIGMFTGGLGLTGILTHGQVIHFLLGRGSSEGLAPAPALCALHAVGAGHGPGAERRPPRRRRLAPRRRGGRLRGVLGAAQRWGGGSGDFLFV